MALKAGAAEADDSWVIGLHLLPRYDELKTAIAGKSKQRDLVLINEKGERFVNEALPYVADHCGMQRVCWVIIDSSTSRRLTSPPNTSTTTSRSTEKTSRSSAAAWAFLPKSSRRP